MRDYEAEQGRQYHEKAVHLDSEIAGPIIAPDHADTVAAVATGGPGGTAGSERPWVRR